MEARERKDKGLCYNCDEKFTPTHKCETQKLFWVEGFLPEEEIGDAETQDPPTYSSLVVVKIHRHKSHYMPLREPQPLRQCGSLGNCDTAS